jgi:uncharacterized protein with NAD-binding domain and iron-sulfur cluster
MVLGMLCPLRWWRSSRPVPDPPKPREPQAKERKIAILGGGMAGLSAAYQLTKTPELRRQNHVTLYQLGWRLGGKAASGRDSEGRNLEHGLHVWFGCYENTFKMLQELYEGRTVPPDAHLKTWRDAVKPQDYTPIGVLGADGSWSYWPLRWPTNDGTPGDGGLLPTLGEMFDTILGWLHGFLAGHGAAAPADVVQAAGQPPAGVTAPTPAAALLAARDHVRRSGRRLYHQNEYQLRDLVRLIAWARDAHAGTRGQGATTGSPDQLVHDVLAILAAAIQGIVTDLILKNEPFESLDDEDFRAWLIRHGADRQLVNTSSVVRIVYDTLFQYADGDVDKPSYAAGTALGVIARLVGTYKGSMMWDIQAGMGEVLVAPLYEHLVKAGVVFKFFREVTSIEPHADQPLVETIRLNRQADVLTGEYQPTISVDGLTCWPAEPLWDQLKDGAAMRAANVNFESHWCDQPPAGQEVLKRGEDFDDVILAISLGAYKNLNDVDRSMCAGLMERSSRFNNYVANVGVVPTQAVQLWCDASTFDMGWQTGKAATVSGPEYLNIWADMSQVIAFEPWPSPAPKSLHYLTGTYKTTLFKEPSTNAAVPQTARTEIRDQTIAWLNASSGTLWPLADPGGKFDWNVLRAPAGATGPQRFDSQFWRANIDPTECCTLSAAGTTQYRLHPDETGFDNLYLAGEGSRHGFNTTAIEGAVMSGAAASRAICGQPVNIVGYDFLQRRPSEGPGS